MKILALAFVMAAPALAGAQGGPGVKATLADLAWIAGHWVNEEGGDLSEEVWTAPTGDSMQGMWRYVAAGRVKIFEALTIVEDAEGVTLRLRRAELPVSL